MIQVAQTKQLVPTMHTQCMRTAFQIPFDATVRISLDTNLCMISERGRGQVIPHITRFPHAILEVKIELGGATTHPPEWVAELQNSGMLYEVHKFSKFIHGCAALLPEYVRAVPYWVDDTSIRDFLVRSGAGKNLVKEDSETGVGPGANEMYDHLLPFGNVKEPHLDAKGRTHATTSLSETGPTKSAVVTGDQYYAGADVSDESTLQGTPARDGCSYSAPATTRSPSCPPAGPSSAG
jgi:hypothetical protein